MEMSVGVSTSAWWFERPGVASGDPTTTKCPGAHTGGTAAEPDAATASAIPHAISVEPAHRTTVSSRAAPQPSSMNPPRESRRPASPRSLRKPALTIELVEDQRAHRVVQELIRVHRRVEELRCALDTAARHHALQRLEGTHHRDAGLFRAALDALVGRPE